jgi:spore maturation protein CgeB
VKVLVVDTYYPKFVADLYRRARLERLPYAAQRQRIFETCFGTADYYSRNLQRLGIEAEEVIANCAPLQLRWVREQRRSWLWGRLPAQLTRPLLVEKLIARLGALVPILKEQVRQARPDVLYLQDLHFLTPRDLGALKREVPLVVGQIASPLPARDFLEPYDLILTSFPHFVPRLRALGVASEYFRLGFDPCVLERVGAQAKRYACTFVGGLSRAHGRGTAFLEHVARHADVDFFGYGVETLAAGSPIRPRHRGEVWGADAFRVFAQSHITLNRHIDVAENNANNMRLYEATGMGALLLTDAKANLGELFVVGEEVVAYENAQDAADKIAYYNAHPDERDAIAHAGHLRTLREHTYERRMVELAAILTRHLQERGKRIPS